MSFIAVIKQKKKSWINRQRSRDPKKLYAKYLTGISNREKESFKCFFIQRCKHRNHQRIINHIKNMLF